MRQSESKDPHLPFVLYQGLAGRSGIHPDSRNPAHPFPKNKVRGEAAPGSRSLDSRFLVPLRSLSLPAFPPALIERTSGTPHVKTRKRTVRVGLRRR